jgi:hypothetical protein
MVINPKLTVLGSRYGACHVMQALRSQAQDGWL